jgi:hypothetical protein
LDQELVLRSWILVAITETEQPLGITRPAGGWPIALCDNSNLNLDVVVPGDVVFQVSVCLAGYQRGSREQSSIQTV